MARIPRTRLAPLLAVVLLALVVAPVAAAAPERSKLTGFTVDFPAGLVCEFAVRWDFKAGGNQLVFPVRSNGDQVVRTNGRTWGTVTNLDDPTKSVTIRGGNRQDLIFHADGTLDARIRGTVVAGYFPTDVGGPSMWLFRGNLHDVVDTTFTATAHSFRGNGTDLCAALS